MGKDSKSENVNLRQKSEQLLIASENRYRRLFESAKDGILILDAETGMITDVNPFLIEMLGYSEDQFLDKVIWEIGFFKDIVANLDKFSELRQKEYVRYDDLPLETADGRKINVEFISNSYFEDNKKVIQCNIRETTIRKQSELALRNSESYLCTLVQTIPDLIWLKDSEGVYLSCKTRFERLFGAREADIIGKTDYDFVDQDRADFFRENDRKAMAAGKPTSNEEWLTFADDGHREFMDTIKTPMYNSNGTLIGMLGIGRDITERKRVEEALRKSEAHFKTIFNEAPLGIALIDSLTGHVYTVNPMFAKITDRTVDEMTNIDWMSITHPDDVQEDLDNMALMNAGKISGFQMEKRYLHHDGTPVWINMMIAPIYVEDKEHPCHLCMIEDITDRKQAEEKLIIANEELVFQNEEKEKRAAELIIAKEKAEESDRLKSAFLANMSHEVRTPLNSIIGFSELLGDPDFEEDQKNEFIQHIIASGNNLLTIISDIMDISKMESGEITIRKKPINAHEYVLGIYEQFSFQAETHKLELILNLPDNDKETEIFADTERLRQIFNNLIGNAFKFTVNGSIEIGYRPKGEMVEFFVKDTGIGIPASYHDKIFDRFRQVEDEKNRKYGGNGLGLAITKNLVGLMGGKIWVDSEEGKGSKFYFTLPMN